MVASVRTQMGKKFAYTSAASPEREPYCVDTNSPFSESPSYMICVFHPLGLWSRVEFLACRAVRCRLPPPTATWSSSQRHLPAQVKGMGCHFCSSSASPSNSSERVSSNFQCLLFSGSESGSGAPLSSCRPASAKPRGAVCTATTAAMASASTARPQTFHFRFTKKPPVLLSYGEGTT